MGQYSKKGLYAAYDKNHKERQAEDYYSTPTEEVENILQRLYDEGKLDLSSKYVLEPSCGGGHMLKGIVNSFSKQGASGIIFGSDIKDRSNKITEELEPKINFYWGEEYDYLRDDYSIGPDIDNIDYVIMNPPFKLIEPFVIRSLDIARRGVLMFGRLQFLEGKGRYENILKNNPPSDVYVYVDRIACFKNGDTSAKVDKIQCYCWYFWDKIELAEIPRLHWIRKAK